jgi:HEAT repeat protein
MVENKMTIELQSNVVKAIKKLASFNDGDRGVIDTIACGDQAISALRALLFRREPSGLYQARCRAVEALRSLRAYNILFEFLSAERAASDPVEYLGDDAVVNAAARALGDVRDERVFRLLLRLAERASLTGVIAALGSFGRAEAIPWLIAALEDDGSRSTAEVALRRLGRAARPALVAGANTRLPSLEHESVSSLRRRRSALALLGEIGITRKIWPQLRPLKQDADARISLLACKLCLEGASPVEWQNALDKLASLLPEADWMLRAEIEKCRAVMDR